MDKIKKIPITRNNLHYDAELHEQQIAWVREFIEEELNLTIILYRLDRNSINPNGEESDLDIYGENNRTKKVKCLEPVELKAYYKIDPSEVRAYNDNQTGKYKQVGNLEFDVVIEYLTELEVDINDGDLVVVPITEVEFQTFEVVDRGEKNFNNEYILMGYKPILKTITCSPTDKTIF